MVSPWKLLPQGGTGNRIGFRPPGLNDFPASDEFFEWKSTQLKTLISKKPEICQEVSLSGLSGLFRLFREV